MKALEKPPAYELTHEVIELSTHYSSRPDVKNFLKKIEDEYLYWDKVKYLPLPNRISPQNIWLVTKFNRELKSNVFFIGNDSFSFSPTTKIQRLLHEFDKRYGSPLFGKPLDDIAKKRYLNSSLMEEAIASSQIEGAVTTRIVAKEMLRQQREPRNQSERMIRNNYITIQRIRELKEENLSSELLLEIQRLITDRTQEDQANVGQFRTTDDVVVVDASDNEIAYQPPPYRELKKFVNDLCRFFNEDPPSYFIHPIIKASIIHFLVGYIHPFADGNGRTARALFYWYLLKYGYWLTEYLSISSIILKTRIQYAKAYLYTETDGHDLNYFIYYQIKVLQDAYENLEKYLHRKEAEKIASYALLTRGGINERQAIVIQQLTDHPTKIFTVKEVETIFAISNQSARTDLQQLESLGWLVSSFVNKKKQVFGKSEKFERLLRGRPKTSGG
ncbi:MAG: Fic family protein [Flammeovirgaceae bacterium]